jgi:hypothetical protein
MTLPHRSAVDAALVALLRGDAALATILGGPEVYLGEGPDQLTKLVLVAPGPSHVERMFTGATAYELLVYTVTANIRATDWVDAFAAAARIDALLDGQALDAVGYSLMVMKRTEHVAPYDERDEHNNVWQHAGALYEIWVSPSAAAPREE